MFDVDFTGIGRDSVTLLAGAGLSETNEGQVAKVLSEKTAGLCSAEDVILGVIGKYDAGGGVVRIDYKGFVTVPYSGTPARGWTELVANGAGGVRPPTTAGNGRRYHVVSIDAATTTLTMLLG